MGTKTKVQLVTALIISTAGFAFFIWRSGINPFKNTHQWSWKFEKTIINAGLDYNQNPDIITLPDSCFRIYSHGTGGAVGTNGLQNIYSYYSCDGLNWKFEGARVTNAAMPAAIISEDGKTRIYFQRGVENDTKQAIMTAVASDGLNFGPAQQLLTTDTGELIGIKSFAHLELIKLDKGYRMYFDETGLTPQDFERYKNENWAWPVSRIRSLYSEDGLSWKLEPGIRIDYEQPPLTLMQKAGSCTVIKEGDTYHMYFAAGFSPWEDTEWWKRVNWSGIYEATSTDGLSWTIIDNSLFDTGSDPKMIKVGDELKILISEGQGRTNNSIDSFARTN